jgi:hypothetical protein
MPFALSVTKIEEAFKLSGCPVCRLVHNEAIHAIDTLLWEETTNPTVRKTINDAYGMCPEHTQMLVASELANTGVPLGVNMIYEMLAKNASQELAHYHPHSRKPGGFGKFLKRLGFRTHNRSFDLLQPRDRCPICKLSDQSARNLLSTLMELLQTNSTEFDPKYSQSGGLCIRHLRLGLAENAREYPGAAQFLADDAASRLKTQHEQMLVFIHKSNWNYNDEELTPQEQAAWQKTVTFFSGLSPAKFNHHIPEY